MVPFNFQVTKVFRDDPLSRQLDEANRIQKEEGVLLNDKNEWTRPAEYMQSLSAECECLEICGQENISSV